MVGVNTPRKDNAPLLQCTHHMCPIRVHWHVKINYREYWRVKVAITNFNYRMNYTQWTLVAQHPNLNNVTQVFSFDYKPVVPYQSISKYTCIFYLRIYFMYVDLFDLMYFEWPNMQMIRACFTVWSFITICWWKPEHMGMCRARYCWRRIRIRSHWNRVGHFPGRFTSMGMNVSFLLLMLTLIYQTLPAKISSHFRVLRFPCFFYFCSIFHKPFSNYCFCKYLVNEVSCTNMCDPICEYF